jgi:hypothetical protein
MAPRPRSRLMTWLTRHIRAQDWGRDVNIVALTGWGQECDRETFAGSRV